MPNTNTRLPLAREIAAALEGEVVESPSFGTVGHINRNGGWLRFWFDKTGALQMRTSKQTDIAVVPYPSDLDALEIVATMCAVVSLQSVDPEAH